MLITSLVQSGIALRRIKKFLLKEELDLTQIARNQNTEYAIIYENVDLGWTNNEISLKKYFKFQTIKLICFNFFVY